MKFLVVIFAMAAAVQGRPGILGATLAYNTPVTYARLVPGAPLGADGRVVDTPEVSVAKAEHAAAHVNERVALANEVVKSADVLTYATPIARTVTPVVGAPGVIATYSTPTVAVGPLSVAGSLTYARVIPAAPVGPDGRVVDTPEVAVAKAEHAAAHINERVSLANEAVKSADLLTVNPAVVSTLSGAPAFALNKLVY
ncbi:cuticle protein 18.7 [Cephus cinctus]|uniref:Cuticle protein 18.7 n=1 Tax=Cephus cinctus TaxID=211228 RepID=A0AAJ7RF72_CEPCN|nr:cuticle protein 18.7 [Cephus cinctus]